MAKQEKIMVIRHIIRQCGSFTTQDVRMHLTYQDRGSRQTLEKFNENGVEVVTYFRGMPRSRNFVSYEYLPENIIDEILYLAQMWESICGGHGRWDNNRWRYGRYERNVWVDGRWYDGRWHGGGWRGGRWHDDDGHGGGHDNGHGGGGHGGGGGHDGGGHGGHGGHDDGHGGHTPPGHEPGHGGGNDSEPRNPRDY